ncbi:D-sedoheptulose 7-phosphate isomerase [Candidatus Thioglobus sp.]|nr:D-sedoheptulose 7-phosphate isomerase [Candidatus Thioglobus sp.]
MNSIIQQEFLEHINTGQKAMESISNDIEIAAITCIYSLKNDGKILILGNGGSAADAQHIAAELVGRYKTERKGLAAIALTTDTSTITSISNDFGYENVFERQIQALANERDVVIGISTGGTSKNVINALSLASALGCKVIGLSGKNGGEMNTICDINIVVPSQDTPRIQEMHIFIGHTICHLIDQEFTN